MADLGALFSLAIFPCSRHRLVYDLTHKSFNMTSLVCYLHLTYDLSLWRVSRQTLKSLKLQTTDGYRILKELET